MLCDPVPLLPSESDDDDEAVNGEVGRVRLRWARSCSESGGHQPLKQSGWLFGPPTKVIFDASRGVTRFPTALFSGKKRPFKRGLVLANDWRH